MDNKKCPKCNGGVSIGKLVSGGIATGGFGIGLSAGGLTFMDSKKVSLGSKGKFSTKAYMCVNCGYIELYGQMDGK